MTKTIPGVAKISCHCARLKGKKGYSKEAIESLSYKNFLNYIDKVL